MLSVVGNALPEAPYRFAVSSINDSGEAIAATGVSVLAIWNEYLRVPLVPADDHLHRPAAGIGGGGGRTSLQGQPERPRRRVGRLELQSPAPPGGPHPVTEPRRLPEVPGLLNFRDAGGHQTRRGSAVQTRRLFRSGALHLASPQAVAFVRDELGVRSVIDLRTMAEVRESGALGELALPPLRRHHLPVIPDGASELLNERFGPGISAGRYLAYLDLGAESFRALFTLLARADSYPAIIHCTAGKDRTGVSVALLGDLLGVSPEIISADYDLSNRARADLIARLLASGREVPEAPEDELERLYGAPPEAIRGFLSGLRRERGSARRYLQSVGVSALAIGEIERQLLG